MLPSPRYVWLGFRIHPDGACTTFDACGPQRRSPTFRRVCRANHRSWYISSVHAAERKAARASWESRVFRNGWEEMADFDALFWDRLPVEERAEAVWELSKELHAIAHPETHERRLPRSAYRVERR
jgi:hypothetical protein